jgi:hypothetical protein
MRDEKSDPLVLFRRHLDLHELPGDELAQVVLVEGDEVVPAMWPGTL